MSAADNTNMNSASGAQIETKKTYCRVCHAHCAMEVDVQGGKPIAVRGDRDDPMYNGYTCIKGRQLMEQYDHPNRIMAPLKRQPDGRFVEISMEQALDEIASKVGSLIKNDGPRTIATYAGTFAYMSSPADLVAKAFHKSINSESYYSTVTIDQVDKVVAMMRFGIWGGGLKHFNDSEVVMNIGCNSPISHAAPPGGIPFYNPSTRYKEFLNRGGVMICIDPRVTEIAKKAQYHLQIRPGEDPTLLAGMIRFVIEENLHDQAFCDQYVEGFDELRQAIDGFTTDYVAMRTGIDEDAFIEAIRVFANAKSGVAVTGVGPDMALHGNLSEHLVLVLNTILGRYAMAGDKANYLRMLMPDPPRKAGVVPTPPAYGQGPKSRFRGLGQVIGEMPTTALPDEIIEPGEGQIKAVFSMGGNPLAAWPDQYKTKQALETLELLVSVDIRMTETCRLSDYVLPARVCLEREDIVYLADRIGLYADPYSHYTQAVCEPNGDPIEDWEFYWELAKRLGIDIEMEGGKAPMDSKPSKLEMLKLALPHARVSLEALREHNGGKRFDDIEVIVEEGDASSPHKFQFTPDGIVDELAAIRNEPLNEKGIRMEDDGFSHLLIARRLKDFHNSNGRDYEAIRKRGTTNLAYMNPEDVQAMGIASGDVIEIKGKHGCIKGVVDATSQLQPGVISMAHGWGDFWGGDEGDVREVGVSTTRLVATDKEYDPIHGKGRQTAVPVNVRPA